VFGGNQPVIGSTIQLYAVGTTGTGVAATPLITPVVTTSDGSGNAANSNANAGNMNNTLPAGSFTIAGDVTCPSTDSQVYIVASGGNPGLATGTNNTALVMLTALGPCGYLSPNTRININEITTVGSMAALYPYAAGYASIGSVTSESTAVAEEFSVATEYMNPTAGLAPGPDLPGGYYGSSTEINTLANALASCVNSSGGSPCTNLFNAVKPPNGTAPTDTVGAILDVLNNPTNNVGGIFMLAAGMTPFQPTLANAPSNWTLPIIQLPQPPYASPAAGTYAGTQMVTLTSVTAGAPIYYTTDGSMPTTSSNLYSGAITVAASETIKAVSANRAGISSPGSNGYTITGSAATPVFSLAPGTYGTPQTFTITSPTPDASVYVTTDGTTPTAASSLVTGVLQLDKSETLKAIAIAGSSSSGVATAAYTIAPASGTIATLAGTGTTYVQNIGSNVGDGLAATGAALNTPSGVAVDGNGNLYIADYNNSRIRKVAASTGIITTVAGNGAVGFSGDGGAATSATLSNAVGIAVDGSGNLYIADTGNNRIRMVAAATGIITTVAGGGTSGLGDGGPATSAALYQPSGIALDASGNLYIADTYNNRIRLVTAATGIIKTIAGNGTRSFAGDGGPATSAEINFPKGVALDASNNLYIADTYNNRIRRVTATTGIIATVAGTGTLGYAGDTGEATGAQLNTPLSVAIDASGNLYIADSGNNVVRTVPVATDIINTIAGNGMQGFAGDRGPATSAELASLSGIALDASGNVFIADTYNNRIREISGATGAITTVAGSGSTNLTGDGGPASLATFSEPTGVALDASGNLYFSDIATGRIRKVTAGTGLISTVAGGGTNYPGDGGPATAAALLQPQGVAVDANGNLYFADFSANLVRKVTATTGIITTVAGGGSGGLGDGGAATSAQLNKPFDVALDASGNLYISDYGNNRVRMVAAATGIISTVAGNGTAGFSGDGTAATGAELSYPTGVVLDSSGNLYIVDAGNDRVREVNVATGKISTIAGNGTAGFAGDGGPATSAEFNGPAGLAFDASGNLYVTDTGGNRIRKITAATGNITTVAGNGTFGLAGDGGAATSAELALPYAVAVDPGGVIYIGDSYNNRIRVVYP